MDLRNMILHRRATLYQRYFFTGICLLLLLQVSLSIRLKRVEIPSVIADGDPVTLVCDVDLEEDDLYSVKWYKGSDEFYRYMPRRDPSVQTYHVEGIHVDRTRSHGGTVVLRSVTPATGGDFRCEASGEKPTFTSVMDGGSLTVVIPPKKHPEVFAVQTNETVELNCTTDESKPAAQIRWFVNGVQMKPSSIEETITRRSSSGLETSFSTLILKLHNREYSPNNGEVSVICEAVIPTPLTLLDRDRHGDFGILAWTSESESLQGTDPLQRRMTSHSDSYGEHFVRSSPSTPFTLLQSLVLRQEFRVAVNCGHLLTESSSLMLLSSYFLAYWIS